MASAPSESSLTKARTISQLRGATPWQLAKLKLSPADDAIICDVVDASSPCACWAQVKL
jgi:hypothetical protein